MANLSMLQPNPAHSWSHQWQVRADYAERSLAYKARDIQVIKPSKCRQRGTAGRCTNFCNGHTARPHTQEEACVEWPLVEWAHTPMGHCSSKEECASVIASKNPPGMSQLCDRMPLVWPLKPKSCFDCLNEENAQYKFSTP